VSVPPALSLALAQLRHHRARWSLLAAGIALIVAVPVLTAGLARSVTAETVRRTITHLDLTERTLLVSQESTSTFRRGTPAENDRDVKAELARLTTTPVLRELLYRQLTAQGQTFILGAVDQLAGQVRITHGRLPRTCTPQHCEVLQLGGSPTALPAAVRSLGVDVVGTAMRTNPLVISGSLDSSNVPVLVGDDADAMGRLSALSLFTRHYVWVSAIDADRVVQLGVGAYIARGAEVDAALDSKVGATSFTRPDDVVQAAGDRAHLSTRRFGLLGGFAAVLLLGFAVVAGIGLRRESALLATLLRRRGATPQQATAVVVLESVLCCLAGAVLGAVLGGVMATFLRSGTGLSALAAAGHALGTAAVSSLLLIAATTVVVIATLLWPDTQGRALWRMLDLVAVACLGAAALAASRGSASSDRLASGGDPIVVALPVLASIVAGLLAARLWSPVARGVERLLPRRSIAGRLALLGSLRRPLRPVATVAFLTAAIASVVFAGSYRATLLASDADQAAFQVPLDATLSASSAAAVPASLVDPTALQAAGVHAYGVLRASATVVRLAGVTDTVTVLGVDDAAIAQMKRWGRTTGASSAAGIALSLRATSVPAGPIAPAGARQLTIAAQGADPQTSVTIWLRDATGRELTVFLTLRGPTLTGTIPTGASGALTAVAFGVDESPDYATHHAHNIGEGNTDQPLLSGRITLSAVRVDGKQVPWNWAAWGSANGAVRATTTTMSLGYKLAGAPVVAVPSYTSQSAQIPIVVDSATAADARGGVLAFSLDGTTPLTGGIVGQLPRLPTVSGPFVLADRQALQQALDLQRPGRAPTEFWLAGHTAALKTVLQKAPYNTLTIATRSAIQHDLDADPVSRGSRLLLVLVGLLALAVAAVALVLLVVGERRDGAGELYAWEADGLAPRVLRRLLLARAVAVAAVAVPVGVAAGLIVAQLGATLVSVDASGATPTPPLAVTLGSMWTPIALIVGVGAGLLVGCAVALSSLRERNPVPALVDLR